jgi:hypothetical protein
MSLDIGEHFSALISVAQESGLFDHVAGAEPKSSPQSGLTCAVWGSALAPVQSSGLTHLSVRAELQFRIYTSMMQEPAEGIDPMVLNAAGALMEAVAQGYSLDGVARAVDLLGSDGEGLRAEAGYMEIDRKIFRVMDVFVPIIINDCWEIGA